MDKNTPEIAREDCPTWGDASTSRQPLAASDGHWNFPAGGKIAVHVESRATLSAREFRSFAALRVAAADALDRAAANEERWVKEMGTATPDEHELWKLAWGLMRREASDYRLKWALLLGRLKDASRGVDRARASLVDFRAAREVPIAELVKVNRAGFAPCVWHADRNPSMKLYADNHAHCFSCQGHGSSIDVAMAKWSCGPREAAERLTRGER